MPILKRHDIPELLQAATMGEQQPVYLLFGERYLCQQAADDLVRALLPDPHQHATQLRIIDGDREDYNQTLTLLRTYSLFGGRQVIQINDSKLFYSKDVARTFWEKALTAHKDDNPEQAARHLARMLALAGVGAAEFPAAANQPASQWKKTFGFNQPESEDLAWAVDIIGSGKADSEPETAAASEGDPAALFSAALEQGIPAGNTLILLAEAVDRRKALFKYIQNNAPALDLSVDGSTSSAGRKDQATVLIELVGKTLADNGKKIDKDAMALLLERVGFHPVAVVNETEKLAMYLGNRETITNADVETIIGRTREEALYELTGAMTGRNIHQALIILKRLLEDGIHSLAILATLRNHFRKLLLIRSLQELREPAYRNTMPFPVFQKNYLPQIKEGREEWQALLWKNHPFALYMQFQQAADFTTAFLVDSLKSVLAAEYRLKGSNLADRLVLENLCFSLMPAEDIGRTRA